MVLIELRIKEFFHKKYLVLDSGCWEWIAARSPSGYGAFGMAYKHGYPQRAHRVSWILYYGPIPMGLQVLHRCDNRACVNPEHLFLGTHQDNMDDREQKGRGNTPKGQENGLSKLTNEQANEIFFSPGSTHYLGKKYGVSHMTISRIKRKKTWKTITPNPETIS